jgi:flagellar assembly protein FliH
MKSSSSVIRGALAGPPTRLGEDAEGAAAFAPFAGGAPRTASGPRPAEARLAEAYARGLAEGLAEGRAGAEAELEGARTTLELLVRDLWAHREELYREVEPDVVRLAIEVARRIVAEVAERDKELAQRLVAEALRRVHARDRVTVRVHPDDLEPVRAQRERWLRMLEGVEHLEILEDRRVPAGGALATTLHGSVDARWTTQLDEIERALLGERKAHDADA